jgi:hypothetical protein
MKNNHKKKSFVYLFFHLNLFFSSLPKSKRKEVINKCYWPLLNLINDSDFNIGIEITGWTLNEIKNIDNKWIIFFKKLLKEKKTYLIGSSYTQAIFPLIPHDINNFNIKYGKQIYKKILNQIPKIAYVNEQCFSKSVVDLYKKQNYQTLIMDWDCIKNNHNIKPQYQFYPQRLKGNRSTINVIWNSSNNFQNFQKTVHSKLSNTEYFEIFKKANLYKEGVVSIYGSDTEIFDFRLKRFENEAKLSNKNTSEWQNIKILLNQFQKKFTFLNLNQINKIYFKTKFHKQLIDITNIENNLPTKKQRKYNPLRWYVGGQDNYLINTLCWRIYLGNNKNTNIKKKLCYFWSSDFRTHIEKNRWNKFLRRIKKDSKFLAKKNFVEDILKKKINKFNVKKNLYLLRNDNENINYDDGGHFFSLDKERGLTLKSFGLIKNKTYYSFIKKYNQGHFYNNRLNVDFYSGHNVVENATSKYSDLDKRGKIKFEKKKNFITISNNLYIKNIIKIDKKWYFDTISKTLYLHNKIKPLGTEFLSIRSNYFNIDHKIFDMKDLNISTKNGGFDTENYNFNKKNNFFHDDPLSSKFTAQNCFGNTSGAISINDKKNYINFNFFHEVGTSAPMLCYQKDRNNSYFLRFLTSFKENNDIKTGFTNRTFESLISINLK